MILSTLHFTAHTPAMKSLHSVGPRLNSSWAAAASDPSEECMVTVSTLERQHMASWSGTASTSNRATLSRGSHRRPGTDPSLNGHKPANSTEKREHCEWPSSWACVRIALGVGKVQSCSLLWQRPIIGTTFVQFVQHNLEKLKIRNQGQIIWCGTSCLICPPPSFNYAANGEKTFMLSDSKMFNSKHPRNGLGSPVQMEKSKSQSNRI